MRSGDVAISIEDVNIEVMIIPGDVSGDVGIALVDDVLATVNGGVGVHGFHTLQPRSLASEASLAPNPPRSASHLEALSFIFNTLEIAIRVSCKARGKAG